MSLTESASFRFPPGLREELAAAARLEGRSLNAEVVVRLTRSLGERGVAAASRGASAADGAASPRSPSGLCPHGRDPVVCEAPACKVARQRA